MFTSDPWGPLIQRLHKTRPGKVDPWTALVIRNVSYKYWNEEQCHSANVTQLSTLGLPTKPSDGCDPEALFIVKDFTTILQKEELARHVTSERAASWVSAAILERLQDSRWRTRARRRALLENLPGALYTLLSVAWVALVMFMSWPQMVTPAVAGAVSTLFVLSPVVWVFAARAVRSRSTSGAPLLTDEVITWWGALDKPSWVVSHLSTKTD